MSASRRQGAGPTRARVIAVRVLERVQRARAFADIALHHSLAHSDLSSVDRGLCTELVYGTLRWRGRIDFLLSHALDREIRSLQPGVASTLRVGAYQIVFMDRIPESAAVDEAVRCARALGAERATGLVNAVLRRLAREHRDIELPSLQDSPLEHLQHALSLPQWIAERWIEIFGAQAASELAAASNLVPPASIRANRLRGSREALLEELLPNFPDARLSPWAPDGIVLGRGVAASQDPLFRAGRYTVQDEASQLVVALLDPQPGDRVLDACAAPGTKTSAIAERLGGRGSVLALDRNRARLRLVARDARRLGLESVTTLERDSTDPLTDLVEPPESGPAQAPFDRILVDAPCSGLGTLRRNPDARWRIRASDVGDLARVQADLLRRSAETLKPGGALVYSTCTLLPDENREVVEGFLRERSDFRLLPPERLPSALAPLLSDDGMLHCLPHVHGTDGFFAARFERTAQSQPEATGSATGD